MRPPRTVNLRPRPLARLATRVRRRLVAALGAAVLPWTIGCNDDPPAATPDTSATSIGTDTAGVPAGVRAPGWREEAGPVLVVPDGAPARASLVFPEFTDSTLTDTTTFDVEGLGAMRVDLLARSGLVRANLPLEPAPGRPPRDGCTQWPAARVAVPDGPSPAWTVAFAAGRVRALPLDSLPGLPSADSARLAAEITRIVSALPHTGDSTFAGRPFFVRTAHRFAIARGTDGLVADVMRWVNQEANPRAEHLLLVAERPSGGRWAAAYVERASGHEETLEVSEVLAAAVVAGAAGPTLVLARDYGDGISYALLERQGPRSWRVRWSSAYAGC